MQEVINPFRITERINVTFIVSENILLGKGIKNGSLPELAACVFPSTRRCHKGEIGVSPRTFALGSGLLLTSMGCGLTVLSRVWTSISNFIRSDHSICMNQLNRNSIPLLYYISFLEHIDHTCPNTNPKCCDLNFTGGLTVKQQTNRIKDKTVI